MRGVRLQPRVLKGIETAWGCRAVVTDAVELAVRPERLVPLWPEMTVPEKTRSFPGEDRIN